MLRVDLGDPTAEPATRRLHDWFVADHNKLYEKSQKSDADYKEAWATAKAEGKHLYCTVRGYECTASHGIDVGGSQNLFYQLHGIAGVHGFDMLHNVYLGINEKVLTSLRKTLVMGSRLEAASRWQIEYLLAVRQHARFSGLRVFASLDSKRNFDDNNSFMVLLPLMFPPHLFPDRVADMPVLDKRGGTKVLMALLTMLQLMRPMHDLGLSERQVQMLEQSAVKYELHALVALPHSLSHSPAQLSHALPLALPRAQDWRLGSPQPQAAHGHRARCTGEDARRPNLRQQCAWRASPCARPQAAYAHGE